MGLERDHTFILCKLALICVVNSLYCHTVYNTASDTNDLQLQIRMTRLLCTKLACLASTQVTRSLRLRIGRKESRWVGNTCMYRHALPPANCVMYHSTINSRLRISVLYLSISTSTWKQVLVFFFVSSRGSNLVLLSYVRQQNSYPQAEVSTKTK